MIETIFRLAILFSLVFLFTYLIKEKTELIKEIKETLSNRLLYSFPFGSLTLLAINLLIYLVIQRGYWHPNNPMWLPFTSASFSNPIGMLLSAFTHMNLSHLYSNLLATAIFAPAAEIIFKTNKKETEIKKYLKRGNKLTRVIRDISTNSWARAFILFPLLWFLVGIFVSISSPLGLGFSGVFFAILGFILILKPIYGIYLYLIEIISRNTLSAFIEPITTTTASIEVTKPVWVNLGVYAHFVGFLVGILLGISFYSIKEKKDSHKPNPTYVFFAILIIGLTKGLDWLFKIESSNQFILYSAAGFLFLLTIAFISSIYWKKHKRTQKTKISYLGTKKSIINKINSLLNNHQFYIALLTMTLIFMSTFMFVATTQLKPTESFNNTAKHQNYEFWYEENQGIVVYNEERNIYALLMSETELNNNKKSVFYIGDILTEKKLTINQYNINLINGEKLKNIWINLENNWTNIHTSETKETGIKLNNSSMTIKYLLNNSLLIKTKDNSFKTIIDVFENKSIEKKQQFIFLGFKNKSLLIKKDGMETIIGEINKFPPKDIK